MITVFVVAFAVVVAVLVQAYGQVNERFVDTWALAHTLTLTDANRPMVHWYLRTARILRTWGALGGLFLVPVVLSSLGVRHQSSLWLSIFAGYLVGALYAELSLVRLAAAGDRTASLVRRELADYLPRGLIVAQRVLGIVIAVGAVGAALAPYGERSPTVTRLHGVGVLAVGALALAFAVGLERVQRWVIQRPQPFAKPALVAADDAIRSQSVHSLAGSGLAVLLVLATFVTWSLAVSDVQILRWTGFIPVALGVPAALIVCLSYGHRSWSVRRPAVGTGGGRP